VSDTDNRARLATVVAELERNGWPVGPLPTDDAPDSVVLARVLIEEKRLRAMAERP